MAYESYKRWGTPSLLALLGVIVGILGSRGVPIGYVPQAQHAAATQRIAELEAMTRPATAPAPAILAVSVVPSTDGQLVTAVYKKTVTLAQAAPFYGGTIAQEGNRLVWTLVPQADLADGEMIASTGALTFPAVSGHGQAPIVADGWNGPAVVAYVTDVFACTFAQTNPAVRIRLELRDNANAGATRTLRVYAADRIPAGTQIRIEWRVDDAEAADVYTAWGKAHPPRFTWADRRGVSIETVEWNGRGILDVAKAAVNASVANNTQGVIYWMPIKSSDRNDNYLGNPSLLATDRPDWPANAAEFIAIHQRAGKRIGFCLRPWKMRRIPGTDDYQRDEAADVVQSMIDEAKWAVANAGASMFYVDSPSGAGIRGCRRLQEAVPGVLFVFEAHGPGWGEIGWQMTDCDGDASSPKVRGVLQGVGDRRCYPDAVAALLHPEALYLTFPGEPSRPLAERKADLARLAGRGDVVLVEPWSGVRAELKALLNREPW